MKAFFRKHTWLGLILVVLASVVVTGFISTRTDGFNDLGALTTRDLNEDNILAIGEEGNYAYEEDKQVRYENGLIVTFNKTGSITINGDIEDAASDTTLVIATVTLKEGTYTLTSGKNGASKTASTKSVWMSVKSVSGDSLNHNGDFGGADTDGSFSLTSETQVNIVLNIHPGNYNNYTVYPVLVEGSEAGGFYA